MQKSGLNARSPLADWLHYLETSHDKSIDMGLDRVNQVVQKLALQRPAPFVITVAGTNGKGTTCRLLELALIEAGYRVGVYSSPHLLRYTERVRIQGKELPPQAHTEALNYLDQQRDVSLSYFEFSTLSAFLLFKQAQLDIAILEVGLGGRLDATNTIDTDFAVITAIDFDHQAFLGDDREKIGYEKAGICRANKPLVVGELDCPQSIIHYAKQLNCSALYQGKDFTFSITKEGCWHWQFLNTDSDNKSVEITWQDLPIPQIPLQNASTALAVLSQLPFTIPQQAIRNSLTNVSLSGRFQFLSTDEITKLTTAIDISFSDTAGYPSIVLDVGHNPHAARYLATQLMAIKAEKRKIWAVCGVLQDKDCTGIFSPLFPLIDEWLLIPLNVARGQDAPTLLEKLQQTHRTITGNATLQATLFTSMQQAIKFAIQQSQPDDLILVFGSFYTVAALLELYDKPPQ